MNNFDEILDGLRDENGKIDSSLHIIEKAIPIEEQMEYFNWAKSIRNDGDIQHKTFWIATLFTPEIDLNRKKDALVILAGLGDIASHRAIETYNSSPLEVELANWGMMAYAESKMLIHSELSGEKQVLISTGLGGIGSKLRFFLAMTTNDRVNFSEFQKEIISQEINFQFDKNNIQIEDFRFTDNFFTIIFLTEIEQNTKDLFLDFILECNTLGCNISTKHLLTNVRVFSDEEIKNTLTQNI